MTLFCVEEHYKKGCLFILIKLCSDISSHPNKATEGVSATIRLPQRDDIACQTAINKIHYLTHFYIFLAIAKSTNESFTKQIVKTTTLNIKGDLSWRHIRANRNFQDDSSFNALNVKLMFVQTRVKTRMDQMIFANCEKKSI